MFCYFFDLHSVSIAGKSLQFPDESHLTQEACLSKFTPLVISHNQLLSCMVYADSCR